MMFLTCQTSQNQSQIKEQTVYAIVMIFGIDLTENSYQRCIVIDIMTDIDIDQEFWYYICDVEIDGVIKTVLLCRRNIS